MKDFNDMNTLLSRAKYEADRFFPNIIMKAYAKVFLPE